MVNFKKEILKDWALPPLQIMFAKAKLFQLQLNCHKAITLSKIPCDSDFQKREGKHSIRKKKKRPILVKSESNKATNRQHRRLD